MNRREFGKTALGVAAVAMVAPRALAATQSRSIIDCIVIDYEKNKKKWVHLKQPDQDGRTFVYKDTSGTIQYRHFEFLGSDGLVVGKSSPMSLWTQCYDSFETEFENLSMPTGGKRFTRSEFTSYVEEVKLYYNGRIVPISDLA
jgi:hypothetical protein